ncbi:retropepsin-like aspartic protease family protein [Pseudoduganella sp. OTU4001]|uniref:retropepsin-like aspartic protease family protein n=1 Tax=Pseudoduganella sp. OTU4001 TaxID=3043854 RepID=UPI00313CA938
MRALILAALLAAAPLAQADVSLVAAMKEKVLLSVNGAAPRTFAVGATLPDGSKLVAVTSNSATFEDKGQRYTVRLGEFAASGAGAGGIGANALVLAPDANGHYSVQGEINGNPVRMLLDTGASLVAIPAPLARQFGLDYRTKGRRAFTQTAAGLSEVWIVKLDRIKVGDFEFANVDASVSEAGLPVILLGNSVLKRLDMKTESGMLTLTKRF